MTSLFDTEVRRRREATPWARVDVEAFLRDAALNDWAATDRDKPAGAELKVRHRPDVASRTWYTLEWTGEDGERHAVESQDFDLLMWRAAEVEMRARRRAEREGMKEVADGFTEGD